MLLRRYPSLGSLFRLQTVTLVAPLGHRRFCTFTHHQLPRLPSHPTRVQALYGPNFKAETTSDMLLALNGVLHTDVYRVSAGPVG